MRKNNYSANINNLIVLCHIIDDWEEFEKKLIPVIANKDTLVKLCDISKGKIDKKVKKFYVENKIIIDKINEYSNISSLIHDCYCQQINIDSFYFFYQYILTHKDKINNILELLEKLKKLGLNELEYNENADFTKETYNVHTNFSTNFRFVYLDQLEAIPSYESNKIKYKSKNSCYKITLNVDDEKISSTSFWNKIYLNDLTFDPNRLPSELSKEETFDKILKLREQKHQQYSAIKDSVDLGIGIADLYLMFDSVNNKINSLSNIEKKEELIELLQTIKNAILEMKTISTEFDKNIATNNPDISEEYLEDEKKKYIIRRSFSNIDLC